MLVSLLFQLVIVTVLVFLLAIAWRLLPGGAKRVPWFVLFCLVSVTPMLHIDGVGTLAMPAFVFWFSPSTLLMHFGNQMAQPGFAIGAVLMTLGIGWFVGKKALGE
ncbi:hypothetical protein [Paraferrimonas sedimenticola]|uniref:Uncharacterized protein n=1 Tax=Paraferrimonas sedimenticola TaxID=375674 RepID=A0AA37W092_9GAMM|nr:hypothetical protein [Paraferrimonas sedimenticola]GLP95173.1 hypothetical protein GCM10007895_04790 [Paraferrimonas sedimenticola]